MIHRLGQVVLALTVLAAPALVTASPAAAGGRDASISAPSRFSPNGDGVKDELRVTIRLKRATDVRLEIAPAGGRTVERKVDLGRLSRGTHTWSWNGRNQSGRTVPDRAYRITAYAGDSHGSASATDRVQVDTVFEPELTAPTYGAAVGAPARVYPRTTVVTDVLPLRAVVHDKKIDHLELVIRNARGRVVRRADVDEPLRTTNGGTWGHGRTVDWAAVRGGKPLPQGRYVAVVKGSDKAGNTGRSRRVRIWVSSDELVWREETTTVMPAETDIGRCDWSTANGCGDQTYCGRVLPSELYAGGLSYRSATCADSSQGRSTADSPHMLEVPEATGVRGLAAVRVSFVGAPTTAGESDRGTLRVPGAGDGATVVGTSGQSDWVEDPWLGAGKVADYFLPQRDPAALWGFSTEGTDSVDVASFTVDVRYLAVAG